MNEQTADLTPIIEYLKTASEIEALSQNPLFQHILFQEVEQRDDLDVTLGEIGQEVIRFRLKHQLISPERYEDWLTRTSMNREDVFTLATLKLKIDRLKNQVTEPELKAFFAEQGSHFDEVKLSGVGVSDRSVIEACANQINQRLITFDQVAIECLLAGYSPHTFTRTTQRRKLPASIQDSLLQAKPGDILEAKLIGKYWYLLRLEAVTPAVLEGKLKEQLRNQFFDRWIKKQAKKLPEIPTCE